jgi:hypothetical protein
MCIKNEAFRFDQPAELGKVDRHRGGCGSNQSNEGATHDKRIVVPDDG